ncbi:MAG: efflux RND transporter periplasmic adaptor subunit [Vicinamibacterales bacterium]
MSELKADLSSLTLSDDLARPRRSKAPWIVLALLVLAAAGWYAQGALAPLVVETAPATFDSNSGPARPTALLTASGYVVARRKAVVSAKIQGRLAELLVEEGSQVQNQQVLARLESADFAAQVERARAQVLQAEARIGSARATIRRAEADVAEARRQQALNERLFGEQILAADTLEVSRSRVRVLEAAIGQAQAELAFADATQAQSRSELAYSQAQLANTVIRAPFAGVVVKKMAEVGESVAPIPPGVNLSTSSGAIVALADMATLEVEVDVAEANVSKLAQDQPADVMIEAFPDKRYRGTLRQVIPTADRTKATVQVKVAILDADPNLKPEMSAKVSFTAAQPPPGAAPTKVVVAPPRAIVDRDGQPAVFVVSDGRVSRVPITTAGTRVTGVEVTAGLTGTEILVLDPPPSLTTGDRVTEKE